MTAPAPGEPGGPQQSGGGVPSAVRGAVLVGLAVIVGVIGLQILDDSNSGSRASNAVIGTVAPSNTTATSVASATSTPPTTVAGNTTTTPTTIGKLRKPGNVKVKVYNASDT